MRKLVLFILLPVFCFIGLNQFSAEIDSFISKFKDNFSNIVAVDEKIPECNEKLSLENIQSAAPGVIEIFDPFEVPLNYISVLANFSTEAIYSENHKKCVAVAFTELSGKQPILYSTFVKEGVSGKQVFIEVEIIENYDYGLISSGIEVFEKKKLNNLSLNRNSTPAEKKLSNNTNNTPEFQRTMDALDDNKSFINFLSENDGKVVEINISMNLLKAKTNNFENEFISANPRDELIHFDTECSEYGCTGTEIHLGLKESSSSFTYAQGVYYLTGRYTVESQPGIWQGNTSMHLISVE